MLVLEQVVEEVVDALRAEGVLLGEVVPADEGELIFVEGDVVAQDLVGHLNH